jgi:glycosyltransferase involved in cell wall biosynthesis
VNLDVSVIIPSYNRAAMLREAIASVLAETHAAFELIIIDDGSTDDTLAMLDALGRDHSSVRFESTPHRGVAAARNHGVELARAPLIAFLDSDDLWHREKLARQLDFMRANPSRKIAQCQEIWLRGGRRVNPGQRHAKRGGDLFIESLRTCLVSASAVIMRAELFRALGGFDEAMLAAEDYDLWLRIMIDQEVALLDEFLLTRRGGRDDQLSASTPAIDRFRIFALMKLLASDRLMRERRLATTDIFVEKCKSYSGGLRRRGRTAAAEFYECAARLAASEWRDGPAPSAIAARDEMRSQLVRGCVGAA